MSEVCRPSGSRYASPFLRFSKSALLDLDLHLLAPFQIFTPKKPRQWNPSSLRLELHFIPKSSIQIPEASIQIPEASIQIPNSTLLSSPLRLLPNPLSTPPPPSSAALSSLYPSIDMKDIVENLFPEVVHDDAAEGNEYSNGTLPPPIEETLIRVAGAILHLIDPQRSVEVGSGDFSLVRLCQGDNTVDVLARIGDGLVQWSLARVGAAVKLDDSHYFFSLHVPHSSVGDGGRDDGENGDGLLNFGLTFASKGQKSLLKELDKLLQAYSCFSVQKVKVKGKDPAAADMLDGSVAREVTPAEGMGSKKQMMVQQSAAYWTTLAPNVEDYSSSIASFIAKGSGQLIKGILWCGEVTLDRLKWGEDFMKRRRIS